MKTNPLKKYLTENNVTPSDFAKLHGIPQPTVWRIANDKIKLPACVTLIKIERATGGQVKAFELAEHLCRAAE